jgi:phage shock protein C
MADYPPSPPASPPPSYPPYAPPPPRPRRLMRSTRERMWAGVAGGMADYFDVDPALVRLLWIAATVVSGGLAVPAYILLWIILPRDDRAPQGGPGAWHDWSEEIHSETRRWAEEARRMADDVKQTSQSWRAPTAGEPPPPTTETMPPRQDVHEPWWQSERYVERPRNHRHHPRSTGIVLVALGVLLLAVNAGVFSWIDWRHMWPVIFIGLGLLLLARRAGGWDR